MAKLFMDNITFNDEELVHLFLSTQKSYYFEQLYVRHVSRIFRKCYLMTGDYEIAQDLTQEIFIKAFQRLNTFKGTAKFSTWIFSISHYSCLDQLRNNKRFSFEPFADDTIEELVEPDINIAEVLYNILTKETEPSELSLLQLKYAQGVSIKELAVQFHISESALKMKLKRLRDKLRYKVVS